MFPAVLVGWLRHRGLDEVWCRVGVAALHVCTGHFSSAYHGKTSRYIFTASAHMLDIDN